MGSEISTEKQDNKSSTTFNINPGGKDIGFYKSIPENRYSSLLSSIGYAKK